jgi:hypothetical protein
MNHRYPPGSLKLVKVTHQRVSPWWRFWRRVYVARYHFRTTAAVLALSLLLIAGCADVTATDGAWRFHGTYLLKDPKLADLHVATTQGTKLDVGSYNSASQLTGADLAAITSAIAKALLPLLP